jgi:hypothetical protein
MNAKNTFARPHVVTTILTAAAASAIAIGLLTAVTGLFEHDGTPFERVVAAEKACSGHAFVSEREACVQSFLATSRVRNIASR